jgi:transcriptional regulator with XRE-family HTH domain
MDCRGMKQADLARATGLSTALIAQIVTGKTKNPQFQHVAVIARALDVTLNYLAGYEEL